MCREKLFEGLRPKRPLKDLPELLLEPVCDDMCQAMVSLETLRLEEEDQELLSIEIS